MIAAAEDRRGDQLGWRSGETGPAEPVKLASDYIGKRREYLLSFAAEMSPAAWPARVITHFECNEFPEIRTNCLGFGFKTLPFVK